MFTVEVMIACAAVIALAVRPRDNVSALVCAAGAVLVVGLRGLAPARAALEATQHGSVATLLALDLADPGEDTNAGVPLAIACAAGLAASVAVLVLLQ